MCNPSNLAGTENWSGLTHSYKLFLFKPPNPYVEALTSCVAIFKKEASKKVLIVRLNNVLSVGTFKKRHQRTLTFSLSLSLFPFLSLSPMSHPPAHHMHWGKDTWGHIKKMAVHKQAKRRTFTRLLKNCKKICLWFSVTQVVCFAMQPRQTDTLI